MRHTVNTRSECIANCTMHDRCLKRRSVKSTHRRKNSNFCQFSALHAGKLLHCVARILRGTPLNYSYSEYVLRNSHDVPNQEEESIGRFPSCKWCEPTLPCVFMVHYVNLLVRVLSHAASSHQWNGEAWSWTKIHQTLNTSPDKHFHIVPGTCWHLSINLEATKPQTGLFSRFHCFVDWGLTIPVRWIMFAVLEARGGDAITFTTLLFRAANAMTRWEAKKEYGKIGETPSKHGDQTWVGGFEVTQLFTAFVSRAFF